MNVGKFNLGFASIRIREHAFYESITHADNRILYGKRVTDFPHVRQGLHEKASSTKAQQLWALEHVHKPAVGTGRYDRVWQQVRELSGTYEMHP